REAADLITYLHRSRDELDRMQQQMTAERHALEEERKKLRNEWVERQQKRIKELEAQFAEMQKRFDENVARVVEAVKERELRAQLEKSTRRKMQDVRSEAREDLNAAVVQTISESQADLGVHSASLEAVSADRLQAGAKINVIGMTVEQASERVDKFLDEAALANKPRVRIIHGHGTGALRKGLAEFLKTHPLVSRSAFESEEHGGKAITVVELRA